jgi:hypothetical protein
MGVPAVAHKGFLQIGKETTWDTPVAATIKLPVLDISIELDAPLIPDNVLHGNPWERTKYQGPRRAMGPFSTQLLFEGELELLRGIFGAYTNSLVETGVRDHTFKIGPTLNGYTLQEIIGDTPAGTCFRDRGGKFNKLTLSGTQGQAAESIVTMAVEVIAKDREENQSPTGALSFPPLLPVKFDLSTVVDDGTADAAGLVRVRQFEFTLENRLTDDRFYASSLFIDEPVRGDKIQATFRFMQEFQSLTQYAAYRALTIGSPRMVFQHPATIGSTSKREFEIRANQAYLDKVSQPVNGPGVIIATSTWVATFDGVDGSEASPVVCRVRNTESALA